MENDAWIEMLYDALDALVEAVGNHDDSLPGMTLNAPYQQAVQALAEADGRVDAEDGGGLAEIARISADADLYRKTAGVVIRREDGSA